MNKLAHNNPEVVDLKALVLVSELLRGRGTDVSELERELLHRLERRADLAAVA